MSILSIKDGFLGLPSDYSLYQKNEFYSGHDSKELYEKNLKDKPIDWYYRDKQITYLYNNLGHRCKKISDINLDNYLLFVGCSHTEGVGNMLEDTYPYIVSKRLDCDYYNLSVGGTGLDTMMHNLNIWMNRIKSKPKYIIWQWPEYTRFLSYDKTDIKFHGMWESDTNIKNFILAGDMVNYFNARMKLVDVLLEYIPNVLEIDFFEKRKNNNIFFEKLDLARDDLHYGYKSNENIANLIVSRLR